MSRDHDHEVEDADEERIQDVIAGAMPPLPERSTDRDDGDFEMTTDEQEKLSDLFHGLVDTLYDRGYTPAELGVITHSVDHWTNARRYDPYEYDRIALSLKLRQTIEEWREDQPEEIPVIEIAEVVEEMGRMYRTNARREIYRGDDDGD